MFILKQKPTESVPCKNETRVQETMGNYISAVCLLFTKMHLL